MTIQIRNRHSPSAGNRPGQPFAGRATCTNLALERGKQRPVLNRDIQRMFEPLRITEQFLLKTNLREVLFRKPADTAETSPAVPTPER